MPHNLKCILLIDDDNLVNFMNKIIIEEEDCIEFIIRKESATLGLRYLTDSADTKNGLPFPGLIFLDIDMPELSGWHFLQYFKDISSNLPGKPIIYILTTSVGKQGVFHVSNAENLDGICEKPLTHEILHAIFEKHFINA